MEDVGGSSPSAGTCCFYATTQSMYLRAECGKGGGTVAESLWGLTVKNSQSGSGVDIFPEGWRKPTFTVTGQVRDDKPGKTGIPVIVMPAPRFASSGVMCTELMAYGQEKGRRLKASGAKRPLHTEG